MDKLLEQGEANFQHYKLPKSEKITSIQFNVAAPSIIQFSDGEEMPSSCLLCKDTPCITASEQETVLEELVSSQKTTKCPTDAIGLDDEGTVAINHESCIKCGLCLYSCPVGAIYIDDDANFFVNNDRTHLISTGKPQAFDYPIAWDNQPLEESDELIGEVINRIQAHPQKGSILNSMVSRLLQEKGITAYLTRQGDVNLRMDGLGKSGDTYLVIEIELNADLDAPRDILDDVAVFSSRYNIPKDSISGLIVLADLPNKRTEYWELTSDIEKVVGLEIFNIPLAALLALLWATKPLTYTDYKLNHENYSSRGAIESALERGVKISNASSLIEAAK